MLSEHPWPFKEHSKNQLLCKRREHCNPCNPLLLHLSTAPNGHAIFETVSAKKLLGSLSKLIREHDGISSTFNTTYFGSPSAFPHSLHSTLPNQNITEIDLFFDFPTKDRHYSSHLVTRIDTIDPALMHHCNETSPA